jgi:hypothetical protein
VKSWPEEMIGEREGRKIGKETRMFFSSDAETPICVHTRSSCNALTRTLAFQCLQSLVFGKLPFCLLAADGFKSFAGEPACSSNASNYVSGFFKKASRLSFSFWRRNMALSSAVAAKTSTQGCSLSVF